jgi:hypothetical protein
MSLSNASIDLIHNLFFNKLDYEPVLESDAAVKVIIYTLFIVIALANKSQWFRLGLALITTERLRRLLTVNLFSQLPSNLTLLFWLKILSMVDFLYLFTKKKDLKKFI